MARQVIFLDMDGVLLPFSTEPLSDKEESNLFPSSTLQPLQRLWKYVTDPSGYPNGSTTKVEWVLSSTWRVQPSYIRDIERALREFGIPLEFSDITDPTMHSERQWEIYDWLAVKHNLLQKPCVWLALDDEDLLEGDNNAEHCPFFQGHVVRTQSQVGLSEGDVDRAIALWNQQLEAIQAKE